MKFVTEFDPLHIIEQPYFGIVFYYVLPPDSNRRICKRAAGASSPGKFRVQDRDCSRTRWHSLLGTRRCRTICIG